MSDAKYFQRGKIQELRSELSSEKKDPKHQRKKMVMKKIVANMTMGNDMSSLFNDVVNCMQVNVLEIKKMVYLYLINYSRSKPDLAGNAVVFFLRDVNDHNPLIRALALRTMSYIHVKEVMEGLLEPLRKGLKDSDPYVRKTAAICVPKFYLYDRNKADEEGFIAMLKDLLLDSNPTVVANAVVALAEISERSPDLTLQLNIRIASKLIAALGECSEWGQAYILETLLYVVPQEPGDAEMLAERVAPRLQHANASVVLNAVKLIIYLMNYMSKLEDVQNMLKKLAPPLVTLLSSGPEVQYVALRNILLIIQKLPSILKDEIKVFFCKYNDPIYVKLAKLEIIFRLATSSNVGQVLSELVEYASEVDVDFVRKSVRAIGRLAIKIPSAAQRCISALLDLIQTKVNYVVQEGIVVIRDIFRKYPNKYESIIGKLCENLDSLDEPEAKSAMIWIIGQYADRIENSDEILDGFMDSFLEDPPEVQLSLLTAVVKLFIKRPTVGQELVPKILKWATEEVDNPDLRDRGYFYWRLLSVDPAAAKAVILSEHPEISTETENMEIGLLDELLLNLSTLASVYHKIPGSFIPNAKSRFLADSKVLHVLAVSKPENNPKPKNTSNNLAPIEGSFNNPYTNEVAPVNDQIVDLLDLDSGDFVSAMGATNSMTDFGNGEMADSNVSYGSNLLGGNYFGNTGSQYDSARSNSLNSYTHVNSIFGADGNFGQLPRTDSSFGTPSNGGFGCSGGSGFFDGSQTQSSVFNTANSDALQQSPFTNSTGDSNIFNNTKQGQSVFDSSLRANSYSSNGGVQASGSYDNNHNFTGQFSNSSGANDTNQHNSLSNEFNQLQVCDSFVPVKTLLLDPQTSQGIEVYVAFARRSGRKQMELQFINRSNLTLTDFAMQLNRNTFGITMDSALEVPPLAPHQSHTSYVLLSLDGPAAQTDPLNILQVAFKSNVGVFYSQTKVPLHILFSEKGCLEQNDFLSNWRDMSSQPEYQFQVDSTTPVTTTEWLRNKLHTNNVFTVADRNINGKIYMFISCMLDDSTLFLVELTFNGPGSVAFSISAKLVPNTGSLGPASSSLLPIFQSAMEGILQS